MRDFAQNKDQSLKAILLLVLGMSFIPLNDVLIKVMSEGLPLAEIVAIRAVISIGILLLFTHGLRSILALDMKTTLLLVGRSMFLVSAMYLYFLALSVLPISTVVSIFFLSPLLITMLSAIFLKERIGLHRITAVVVALIGVGLIMQPGTNVFEPEMLLALGAALSYAVFQIITRSLRFVGDLPALVTIQHLCYLISALPLLSYNVFGDWQPSANKSTDFLLRPTAVPSLAEFVFLFICAATVLFLSFSSSFAYRKAEASLVAPFEYVAIPVSVLWGICIWGEWPEFLSWIGMLFILFGGIYAIYREKKLKMMVALNLPSQATELNNVPENKKSKLF